jgi:hypothetical protein
LVSDREDRTFLWPVVAVSVAFVWTLWPFSGGLAVFGVNGFIIGPVIAAMFMAVWDIFAMARAR